MNSTIIDLAARLKNGYLAKKDSILAMYSKINIETLRILKEEGYIKDYTLIEDGNKKSIKIDLLYHGKESAVKGIKSISKPGQRIYKKTKDIDSVLGGLGLSVITTPKGIMTDKVARKNNIGGEVLFKIW